MIVQPHLKHIFQTRLVVDISGGLFLLLLLRRLKVVQFWFGVRLGIVFHLIWYFHLQLNIQNLDFVTTKDF